MVESGRRRPAASVYNVAVAATNQRHRPARLGRALAKGLRETYDRLGFVIAASLTAFAGTAALAALAVRIIDAVRPGIYLGAALLMPAVFFYWLCAAGTFCIAHNAVYHQRHSTSDTLSGIRKALVPAAKLFAVDTAVMAVLLGDAAFFLSLGPGGLGLIMAVVCIYAAGLWASAAMYHLPLLPAQITMESGPKPVVIIRKSFLLAFGNPGFTLGLFVAIIALAVLCAIPAGLGIAALFPGAAAFLLTHGLRELFVRYGIVEEEPEVVEDTGWPRG